MHLNNDQKKVIKELYARTCHTVDSLPYTSEFDSMYTSFIDTTCRNITKHDFWRAISGLRKAGQLPRKVR